MLYQLLRLCISKKTVSNNKACLDVALGICGWYMTPNQLLALCRAKMSEHRRPLIRSSEPKAVFVVPKCQNTGGLLFGPVYL